MEFSKVLNLYVSKHGHTREVVKSVGQFATHDLSKGLPQLSCFEVVIIYCPTYGDEEIPIEMEDFLEQLKVTNMRYTICELGNYFGYEEGPFGALPIIKGKLSALSWHEFFPSLSLDSLPQIDWEALSLWKGRLYEILRSL